MNQSQRELRRAAAKAFMESLDQMERNRSLSEQTKDASITQKQPNPREDCRFTAAFKELEDAVADIEQYTREADE